MICKQKGVMIFKTFQTQLFFNQLQILFVYKDYTITKYKRNIILMSNVIKNNTVK